MKANAGGPILSICIPTYNRSEYLKNTLDSIVSQSVFLETDQAEIVISDNASDDDTFSVAEGFRSRFPQKIILNRNSNNIRDQNFPKALSLGNGQFLKLHNDTLILASGALSRMLELIVAETAERPTLFFTNKPGDSETALRRLDGLDAFLGEVSYNCTWIGGFGLWREDFYAIPDFDRYAKLQLSQTDALFRSIAAKKSTVVINEEFFILQNMDKKGGYDLITVFGDNYTALLKQAIAAGTLSVGAYEQELRRLLFNFFWMWLNLCRSQPEVYTFAIPRYFSRLQRIYSWRPYFYLFILKLKWTALNDFFQGVMRVFKKIAKKAISWIAGFTTDR